MKGHMPLLAMRRSGAVPAMVFIDVDFPPSGWAVLWPLETPYRAHVEIEAGEPLSGLDFTFCVGLTVFVQGPNQKRVEAVAEACHEAGAVRVVSAAGAVVVDRERSCNPAT